MCCIECCLELSKSPLWSAFATSVIASIVVLCATYVYTRLRQYEKYGKVAGNYIGYGFEPIYPNIKGIKNEKLLKKTIDDTNPLSKAVITYKYPNILNIRVSHKEEGYKEDLVWEGDIYMESETRGSVAWRYLNLKKIKEKKQHSFGLKHCIINARDNDDIFVYMLGEFGTRFGNEIFIKNNMS